MVYSKEIQRYNIMPDETDLISDDHPTSNNVILIAISIRLILMCPTVIS